MAIKRIRFLESEDQESERARFLSEARGAGRLSHPNIVQLHDVAVDEQTGEGVLTMELVAGSTLRDLMAERGPLSVFEAGHWLRQIAAALDYAHGRGLVHRDIKPGNVLIDSGGNGKLTDFGIATLHGSMGGEDATFVGTPSYMAPEQIRGGDVDARADVFALGVMVYEMLTGTKPFQGKNLTEIGHRILRSEPAPLRREDGKEIPREVGRVLQTALAKEPKDRFASAGEFEAAYRGVVVQAGDTSRPTWLWGAGVAAAFFLVASGLWITVGQQDEAATRVERPMSWQEEVASEDRIQRAPPPPESLDRLSRLLEEGREAMVNGDLRSAAVAAAAVLLADPENPGGLRLQRQVETRLAGTVPTRPVVPELSVPAPEDLLDRRAAATEGDLRLTIVSEVRRGLVMIYSGERQLAKREFRLERRASADRPVRQELDGLVRAPSGELKVYVVRAGQAARSVDLEFSPRDGDVTTLEVRVPRRGLPEARLVEPGASPP